MPVKQATHYIDNASIALRLRTIYIICIQVWKHRKYTTVSHFWNPFFCKYTMMTTRMWPYFSVAPTVYSCTTPLIPIHEWQQMMPADKITPHLFTYYWSWFGYWMYEVRDGMREDHSKRQKYCRHLRTTPILFFFLFTTLMLRKAWGR